MSGLLFEHGEWAPWLAAALVLTAFGLWLARRDARQRWATLVGARRTPRASGWGRDLLLFGALAAISIGALGPRMGERLVTLDGGGSDIVLLVDLSASMRARDVPPSRLARAIDIGTALLAGLPAGDRVALAGVAGRGVLFTPLTPDHAAVAEMLAHFDTRLIQPQGSDLHAGIIAALAAFEDDAARPRTIVLLTDGEQNRAAAVDAGVRAAREQVRVVSVAVGTQAGATIPDSGVALRDAGNRIVTSHRRTQLLEALATDTRGGVLIADAWGELAPGALSAEVRRDPFALPVSTTDSHAAPGPGDTRVRRVGGPAPLPFAALGFTLLLFDLLLAAAAQAAPKRRPGHRLLAGAATLALLGAAAGTDTALRALQDAERALDAQRLDRARDAYREVARAESPARLAAMAEHNLGVLALEAYRFDEAHDRFSAAAARHASATAECEAPDAAPRACMHVALDAARAAQTRANLEWTRSRLEQRPRISDPGLDPHRPQDEARERDGTKPEDTALPAQATQPRPTPLSEAERRAWLARVEDDTRRALQRTAAAGRTGRSGEPGDARW